MSSEGRDLKWWHSLDKVRESHALNREERYWRLQVARVSLPVPAPRATLALGELSPQHPGLCWPWTSSSSTPAKLTKGQALPSVQIS